MSWLLLKTEPQMDERGDELTSDLLLRLQEGLLPLVTKLDAKKVQLGKLEAEVQDRAQVLEAVEQKIETSQKILRSDFQVSNLALACLPLHSASWKFR